MSRDKRSYALFVYHYCKLNYDRYIMQKMKVKTLRNIGKWALQNYFILIVIGCIGFVGMVSVYRLFMKKPTYIYVKVRVGQGLWWASTQKPSMWFVQALKSIKAEKDFIGNPLVQVLSVSYYPWYGSNQFDVYLNLKIRVSQMGKTDRFSFKRSVIGVGSPIDFEFDTTQFSGTIIKLSKIPIVETYTEKLVTITKKEAYPWEYDAIQIGDSVHNGLETVFQIISKDSIDTLRLTPDYYGNYFPDSKETKKYIIVKVKLRVAEVEDKLIYAEDQIVVPGKDINISTSHFTFSDFIIAKVE